MRTDFLGECDLFYGLPEALNRSRYLVPRLTRQQLREAIEGPALLLGARIEPRLLDHLLNELGDRFDRLPVLQHALLRTWDSWQQSGGVGPIDFPHYESAGRLDRALDRDAEGALKGLDTGITAAIFKRLTDTDVRQRRVRNPARVSELMATSGADRATVDTIVRRFEEGGRSFVYASADGTPDDPRVDISHESLIRQWDRLRQWVDDERRSRDRYKELVARARRRERGEAALLQGPELRTAADWRDQARPSPSWAARYAEAGDDFESAVAYLDASVDAECHTLAEAELGRRWRIWNYAILPIVLALAVVSGDWLARPSTVAPPGETDASVRDRVEGAVESRLAPAKIAVETARVGELDWTTDDRRQAVDWNAASAYCENLIVGSRSDWRLPTTGELLDIYDPASPTPEGLKLKPPFHGGVTSQWIWSDEAGEGSSTAARRRLQGRPVRAVARRLCRQRARRVRHVVAARRKSREPGEQAKGRARPRPQQPSLRCLRARLPRARLGGEAGPSPAGLSGHPPELRRHRWAEPERAGREGRRAPRRRGGAPHELRLRGAPRRWLLDRHGALARGCAARLPRDRDRAGRPGHRHVPVGRTHRRHARPE